MFVLSWVIFWPTILTSLISQVGIRKRKLNQVLALFYHFFVKMVTLRNQNKLVAVNRDNHEGHSRNSHSWNTAILGSQEDPFTQVSEKMEERVTRNWSQGFDTTESRILGALSKFDKKSFRIHKSACNPEPSRKHPRILREKTRNQLRTVPIMILILKYVPSSFSPLNLWIQTQMRHLTATNSHFLQHLSLFDNDGKASFQFCYCSSGSQATARFFFFRHRLKSFYF